MTCPRRLQLQTSWTGFILMGKMTFRRAMCKSCSDNGDRCPEHPNSSQDYFYPPRSLRQTPNRSHLDGENYKSKVLSKSCSFNGDIQTADRILHIVIMSWIEVIWTTPTEALGVLPVIVIFGHWKYSQYCYTTFVGVQQFESAPKNTIPFGYWSGSTKISTLGVLP